MKKIMIKKKHIVVIGGGGGGGSTLDALRDTGHDISSVVTMADSGGSTGVLRRELGVHAPGDIRRHIEGLSHAPEETRALLAYRFSHGTLKGHSMGNLLLAGAERATKSIEQAIDIVGNMCKVGGSILPVTLGNVQIHAIFENKKKLTSEADIAKSTYFKSLLLRDLYITPKNTRANPRALDAIGRADLIVIAPGNIYTSILPILLIPGVSRALADSRAKKVLIVNPVLVKKQYSAMCVHQIVEEIERHTNSQVCDIIAYNTSAVPKDILTHYMPVAQQNCCRVFAKSQHRRFLRLRLGPNKKSASAHDAISHQRSPVAYHGAHMRKILLKLL
jgi:uncharacterized cofD-like protein